MATNRRRTPNKPITTADLRTCGLPVPLTRPFVVPWRDLDALFCAIAFEPERARADYLATLMHSLPLNSDALH